MTSLAQKYIMEAMPSKMALFVTHKADFLPAFDDMLVMVDEKIVKTRTYVQLLDSGKQFQGLENIKQYMVLYTKLLMTLSMSCSQQFGLTNSEVFLLSWGKHFDF